MAQNPPYPPAGKRNNTLFLFIDNLFTRIRKRQVFIFFASCLGMFILFLLFRNPLLRSFSEKINSSATRSTHLIFSWKDISFTGLRSIEITDLCILGDSSRQTDTLCFVSKIRLTPAYIPLIIGKKRLRYIHLEKGFLQIANLPSSGEDITIQNEDSLDIPQDSAKINFAKGIESLVYRIRKYLPGKFICRDIRFILKENPDEATFECRTLELKGKHITGKFTQNCTNGFRDFSVQGEINKRRKFFSLQVYPDSTSGIRIPFLQHFFKAELGFDSLEINLMVGKSHSGVVPVFIDVKTAGFIVEHKAISPDPVIINHGELHLKFLAGMDRMELDSISDVGFNNFHFSPWICYDGDDCKTIKFKILPIKFHADSLLNSVPQGLFSNFAGMETSGTLNFQLYVRIPMLCPDSARFFSLLKGDQFRIDKFGVTDFREMNGPFLHDIYERDQYIRSILVSSENPDFVSLQDISPLLVSSVLTSEDGAFYWHEGFNPEAFRDALAENIRAKRFVRGGSTISMQLVKNVYLTRKKTIARKAEEAFIVWLIESLNLIPKERMLEVYLNIIEWGPGIYGIGPASRFYFDKQPRDLNLQESIFLAAIVPRPKSFRYTFVQNGELKPYMADYYKVLEDHLIKQQKIFPEDTIGLRPHVWLSGPARFQLKVQDSVRVDTAFPELEQIPLLNISNFPLTPKQIP